MLNHNSKLPARDEIDRQLPGAGSASQNKKKTNIRGALAVAINTRLRSVKGTQIRFDGDQIKSKWKKVDAIAVVDTHTVPTDFFDFIVIDGCLHSIYNLWKQVLDYVDAFQIGLTASPIAAPLVISIITLYPFTAVRKPWKMECWCLTMYSRFKQRSPGMAQRFRLGMD